MPYSVDEFAAQIKQKYPDYASWPNDHLVSEIVTKHPEYQSWVTLDPRTSARMSLASRGLTPDAVKAGGGVTQPEDITFAAPTEKNGGFMGGFTSNPMAGMNASMDAVMGRHQQSRSDEQGHSVAPTTEQAVGNVLVPDYQGIALESMRRGAANESTSDMYGKATQAAAFTAAGEMATRLPGRLNASAESQYRGVVDPSGKNALAPAVAQDMLDQRIITRNPRETIAQIAEAKAKAGDVKLNDAISNMQGSVDAGAVASKIDEARAKLYNPDTGAPLQPESDAIATKLDTYSANHVLGNAKAHVDANGNIVFEMEPEVARQIKQSFDKKPYGSGSETGTAEAQKAVGDSLRGELNKDPGVAAANKQITDALNVKTEVAPYAAKDTLPSAKRVLGAVGRTALAEGVGAVFPPARMAGHLAASYMGLASIPSIVIDFMRSPAWKTTSAVTKARLAAAIASHDYGAVAQIAGGIDATNQ